MGEMDELRERFLDSECAKLYPDANNVVWGRGSEDPRVVFVGEAPGAEEDRQGLPFVGRSGELLDEWIDRLGLSDEYYIANVMKTRPPGNRDPAKEEVEACKHWLDEQLEILDPEIVVCLGRFAMQHFMPEKRAVLKNSKRLLRGTYYVIPHPSYFLRQGGNGWEEYVEPLKQILKEPQTTLF